MRIGSLLLPIFIVSVFWSVAVFAQAEAVKPSADTGQTSGPNNKIASATKSAGEDAFVSADAAFQAATQAFQQANYKVADQRFETASRLDNHLNVRTLYNWGLTKQKLSQKGWAIALWRRALIVSPFDRLTSVSLDALIQSLDHRDLAHQTSAWEMFRANVLIWLPSYFMQIGALSLLFFSALLWLRFLGRRRKANIEEQEAPSVGFLTPVITILFMLQAFLLVAKVYDSFEPRAIIIEAKVEARSGPSTQSPALFELYEGLEVVVGQTTSENEKEHWTQVTYPGGLTGWIPSKNLIQTSEKIL